MTQTTLSIQDHPADTQEALSNSALRMQVIAEASSEITQLLGRGLAEAAVA